MFSMLLDYSFLDSGDCSLCALYLRQAVPIVTAVVLRHLQVIQRQCEVCKGSGLIQRGKLNRLYKCNACGKSILPILIIAWLCCTFTRPTIKHLLMRISMRSLFSREKCNAVTVACRWFSPLAVLGPLLRIESRQRWSAAVSEGLLLAIALHLHVVTRKFCCKALGAFVGTTLCWLVGS